MARTVSNVIPWYTWVIAAAPIGGGILWYILSQLKAGRVAEAKANSAESYIKSDIEKKQAEKDIAAKVDEAKTNANPDLGRW